MFNLYLKYQNLNLQFFNKKLTINRLCIHILNTTNIRRQSKYVFTIHGHNRYIPDTFQEIKISNIFKK
jgi:hypothetical protein